MTLTTTLFNSRQYNATNSTYAYTSPVVDVLAQLEQAATAQGLTVSRWQANGSGRSVSITYAVHTGDRPAQARHLTTEQTVAIQTLSSLEGKTARCEAFSALSSLLSSIQSN